MPKKALRTMNIELRTYNYALCIMNYELTLGIPHYVLHTCLLSVAPNGADLSKKKRLS